MNELPKHISYSSLSTWQECGWRYYLTKMAGVQEKHAVWFTGGSALHKATELYDKSEHKDFPNLETLWNHDWFEQVKEDEEANGGGFIFGLPDYTLPEFRERLEKKGK